MNDGFAWWLIVVGIAIGVGLVWVFVIRLPRSEADVGASETPIEAEWISRNIETYGGLAPQPLVEEVLELHRQYLVTGATPLPPTWRPSPDDDGAGRGAEPAESAAATGSATTTGPVTSPEPATPDVSSPPVPLLVAPLSGQEPIADAPTESEHGSGQTT